MTKVDCVMVCCRMVRNKEIPTSDVQELVSEHSDYPCGDLPQDNLLLVFCQMARMGKIPPLVVEELIAKYRLNSRCLAGAV